VTGVARPLVQFATYHYLSDARHPISLPLQLERRKAVRTYRTRRGAADRASRRVTSASRTRFIGICARACADVRSRSANLVLLCARHHTLVQQLGFALVLHADRTLTVTTPEGGPLLHHPGIPWGNPAELDPERRINADTLPQDDVVGRVDIRYAVLVLTQQSA